MSIIDELKGGQENLLWDIHDAAVFFMGDRSPVVLKLINFEVMVMNSLSSI